MKIMMAFLCITHSMPTLIILHIPDSLFLPHLVVLFALCIEKNLIKYELLRTQGKNNGETITKNCPETEKNTLKFPIEVQRDLVSQGNLRREES